MARSSKENIIAVEPRLLNIKAAALYLSTTVWYMRTLIWERRIPFLKLGNAYGFDRQDLDAFVASQKTAARA
jgi:excisionase family DNA binding protein